MPTAVLYVRLLSGFAVKRSDGSQAGPWERPHAKRLFQILVLRPGHRIGREELATILFPDLRPDRAANSVSKALTLARQALEGQGVRVLEANRSSIWIADGVELQSDLERVQRDLRNGLAMPSGEARAQALTDALTERGELLPDEPYADWAGAPRELLRQLRDQALLERARDCSRSSDSGGDGGAFQAWIDVFVRDPTSEEAASALMGAYISGGERDRAVRTYHRCRAALQEELAVEPSPELDRLHERALALVSTSIAGPKRRASASSPMVALGREGLVEHLTARLCAAPGRRSTALLVTGVAGIGKTHLLEAVVQRLELRGYRIAQGAAVPDDRRVPYAALSMALRPLTLGQPALLDGLPLVAALVGVRDAGRDPDSMARDEDRSRLAAETSELLARAALQSPLLIALDDTQWMDRELQGLLSRLVVRQTIGCAFLLAARSDEPHAAVPPLPGSVERFTLQPLDTRTVRAIVRRTVPTVARRKRLLAAVAERSQGVPFFAIELARHAASSEAEPGTTTLARVPATIADLLRSRIAQCSPAAGRILPLVALAGQDASYELLLAAGSGPDLAGSPESCIRALDELVQAQLVGESGRGVGVVHPLFRDAALAAVTGLRRGLLHRAIADELEAVGADAQVIAQHRLSAFEAAGLAELAPAAAEAAFRAGTQARALFADDAALGLLQGGLAAFEALRPPQRDRLRPAALDAAVLLAWIFLERRDEDACQAVLGPALELAGTDGELGRVWIALAEIPYRRGDMAKAAAVYERGLESLADGAEPSRSRLKARLGWTHYRRGNLDQALELLTEAESVLEDQDDRLELSRCLDYLGQTRSALGRGNEALGTLDRAGGYARESGDQRWLATVLMHRGAVLAELGRGEEALDELAESASVFEATRERYLRSVNHWLTAEALDSLGRLQEALAERDRELELLEKLDNPRHVASSHAHRATLLSRLGRPDDALAAKRLAAASAAESGEPILGWQPGTDAGPDPVRWTDRGLVPLRRYPSSS